MAGLYPPDKDDPTWTFVTMGCGCCSAYLHTKAAIAGEIATYEKWLKDQLATVEKFKEEMM